MADIDVILISSILPQKTQAAAVTLYRHLVDQQGVRLHVMPVGTQDSDRQSRFARLLNRLRYTRLGRWIGDIDLLAHVFLSFERRLPPPPTTKRAIVLTLAYGSACWVAERYARKHGLPLAVRFDDWWPDIAPVHRPLRGWLRRHFIRLHRTANVSICISDGMRDALGPHPNARVILPIPDYKVLQPPGERLAQTPHRVCYLGNMHDYGPMLGQLASSSLRDEAVRIEFRGGTPRWPQQLIDNMRSRGLLHEFADGPAFESWFSSFDSYLVAMFFEPEQRRRVETCFATKLTEYSRSGAPIVVWAPQTAAIVRWAEQTGGALCVTDAEPEALLRELRRLASDTQLQDDLAARSRAAYANEFSPGRLQRQFIDALQSAIPSSDGVEVPRAAF